MNFDAKSLKKIYLRANLKNEFAAKLKKNEFDANFKNFCANLKKK